MGRKLHSVDLGTPVYADASLGISVLDLHKEKKQKNLVVAGSGKVEIVQATERGFGHVIDFGQWLPAAAPAYNISDKVEDYVLTPVLTIITELPNRNCVGFPKEELFRFNVDQGMRAFRTFVGKPVHLEHDNQEPLKALGVIVDAVMMPIPDYGNGMLWGLVELLAIDRTKNPFVAQKIIQKELNTYSMGAWVKSFTCGLCNADIGKCNHISPNRKFDFYPLNGALVYRLCKGVTGFETSVVMSPAYVVALSDKLISF